MADDRGDLGLIDAHGVEGQLGSVSIKEFVSTPLLEISGTVSA